MAKKKQINRVKNKCTLIFDMLSVLFHTTKRWLTFITKRGWILIETSNQESNTCLWALAKMSTFLKDVQFLWCSIIQNFVFFFLLFTGPCRGGMGYFTIYKKWIRNSHLYWKKGKEASCTSNQEM